MPIDLRLVFVIAVVILLAMVVIAVLKKAFVIVAFLVILALFVPPFYTVAFGDGTSIVETIAGYLPEEMGDSLVEGYAYYREKDIGNDLFGADEADNVIDGITQYGQDKFESAFTEEDETVFGQ